MVSQNSLRVCYVYRINSSFLMNCFQQLTSTFSGSVSLCRAVSSSKSLAAYSVRQSSFAINGK